VSEGEYCNVCENFPCLGNHPPGEIEEALDDVAPQERFRCCGQDMLVADVFGLKVYRCAHRPAHGRIFSDPPRGRFILEDSSMYGPQA
jgi:hypothetical protein